MIISDPWHCILTFPRSSEITDLDRPHAYSLPIVAKWVVLGFLEFLRWNTWFTFKRPVFKAPLAFQMSITAIRQVCPRAIFPVSLMFPSGILCIINRIWSRCENNMSFCLELNVEQDGEGFISIRLTALDILTRKSGKLLISGKFDLWLHITG